MVETQILVQDVILESIPLHMSLQALPNFTSRFGLLSLDLSWSKFRPAYFHSFPLVFFPDLSCLVLRPNKKNKKLPAPRARTLSNIPASYQTNL